jgi:transcriptional regulator with XRE-family HTH domain
MATSHGFDLGGILRTWRLESGIKPEQVCVDAGVSYPYLRAIEDGKRYSPSIALLARLAAVYGHDVSELFTTTPAGTP